MSVQSSPLSDFYNTLIGIHNTDNFINIGIHNTDMDIAILAEQNQWWKSKELIEDDIDIVKWEGKKLKWIPKILEEIHLVPFSLHIISGPRQVGKTTGIKLLIKRLLKQKNPKSLFYFNCEELSDFKELIEVIETYLLLKENEGIKTSYIFLDEITKPNEWYRGIKVLIDKGKFRNDVIILTGSSSISIKRQTELFPGRRGKGKDYLMFPLSFREFLSVINPEIYKKIPPIRKIEELEKNTIKAMIYLRELNQSLEKYFIYGGFPSSIERIYNKNIDAKRTYLSWIKTDILKSGKSDNIAKQILKSVIEKMPSPMSWEGISKEIEIKSPKTVSSYVELLRSLYSLIVLYHVDISKKIKFGKNKKIHVIDPFLLQVFEDWCMLKLKNKENILSESIAAAHLARFFAKRNNKTVIDDEVFYWKNSTEIDVVVIDKGVKGFEIKWANNIKMKKHPIKDYIILSKNKFQRNPLTIPLSVFLSLLDV